MTHAFDQDHWEQHWRQAHHDGPGAVNPHVRRETAGLVPGTALDAGCGAGAEAIWLASRGWQVTAADIASEALAVARAASPDARWVAADLTVWAPGRRSDLDPAGWAIVTAEEHHRTAGTVTLHDAVVRATRRS